MDLETEALSWHNHPKNTEQIVDRGGSRKVSPGCWASDASYRSVAVIIIINRGWIYAFGSERGLLSFGKVNITFSTVTFFRRQKYVIK